MTPASHPELSRVSRTSALAADPSARELEIEATPTECAALAERFGLVSLDRFRASVRLRPLRGSCDFRLSGHISARAVQSCVVTLDPVASEIEHDFDLLLCDEENADYDRLDEAGEDYELFSGDSIDIGEIVAVEFALSIDPYPRTPGISLEDAVEGAGPTGEGVAAGERVNRPFEALARLKGRK